VSHTPDRARTRERFLNVDTANISDVLEDLGHSNQALSPDIAAVAGTRLAGWAYTLLGAMVPYEGNGDPRKMEACHGIGPHEVSVWSGRADGVCYFGELIAVGMMQRGSAGALVDGGVRDVRVLREHGFPVFARYHSPVQSIRRWKVTEWQVAVTLPGATTGLVTVNPGDFVAADEDGVVVVPAHLVEDVLSRAEAITQTEQQVRAALRDGLTLAEALDRFGHV
jgi:4-hydroxy-4-methyl-2-oxoglutarate aldolase